MINLRINYDQNKYAKIEQGIRQMYSNHPDPSSAEAAFSVAGLIADAFPYISPAEAMRNSNTIIKQYTGHDLDPVGAWQEFGKTFKAQASDLASSMKMAKNMIEFSKSKDQEAFTKMRDEYLEEMRNSVPSYRNDFKKMSFVTDLLIESGRIIPSQIPSMGIYIAGSVLAPATMGASLAFSRGAGALYSGMMEAGGLVKELLLVEDELGNTLDNDLIMSAFTLTLGGVSALNLVGDRFSKGVANSVTKLFGKKNISSAIKSGAVRSVATKILLNKLEGIGSEAVEESLEELIGMLATNYVMDKSNKDSDTLFEGHSKDDIIKAMVEVGISTAKGMVFAGLPGDAMQAINEYTSNDTNLKREANKVSPYTTDSYAIDMANIVKPKAKYDSKVDKADAPVNLVQVAGVYKAADDTSSHVIYSLKENGAKAVNANIIENTSTPTETSKTVAYNISRNTGVPIKGGKLLFNNQQEMESFTESIARDNDKFVGYHPEEGKVTLDYKDETGLHAIEFLVDETVKSRKEVLEAERDNKPMQTKMDGSEQDLDSQMKLLEREFTSEDAPNPDKLDRKFYRPYFKALKDKGATDSDISFLHSKVLPQIYDTVKQQNPKLSSVQVYHQALPSSYLMFLASRVAGMDTESFYNQTFAETGFGVLTEASQKAFLRSSQGHQSAEVELGKGTTENVVVNGLLWTNKNGKRVIGLGEGATPLTIAHELGHVILDSIKGTESFNDFAQLYADEIAKDNGLIGRYTNERFAHDLETYLQTGVAKDPATRTIFMKIAQAIKDFIGFIRGELDPEVVKAFDDLFDTDNRSEYNVIGDKHGQKQTSGINDSRAKLSENIRRGEAEQLESLSPEDKKLGNRVPGRRSTLQQEQSTVFHRRVLPDNSRQLTLHNGNIANVVAEFSPNQKYSEIIQRKGKSAFTIYEIDNAAAFNDAISEGSKSLGLEGIKVEVKGPEAYENMRLFTNENGTAGFALDGQDVVSVFKHKDGPDGAVYSLLPVSIMEGGRTLDAFDGKLPSIYSKFGFEAVARTPFNREFAPDGWDYDSLGDPDVVFMSYTLGDPAKNWIYFTTQDIPTDYKPGMGEMVTDWDDGVALQQKALEEQLSSLKNIDKVIHASLTEEAASEMEDLRKQYEGTSQWLKAPNGKDSNLNAFQWLQVRTKAFKAWYGDWENDPENSSLILDENGEPLEVYHGTLFTFDRFDRNKAEGYGDLGAGFYFTNTPADADSNYASKEGGDVSVKVRNIAIELAKDTGKNFYDPEIMKEAWKIFGADHEGVLIPAYLNMRNPVFLDDYYDTKKTFLNVDAEERWERYKAEAKELLIDKYGEDIPLTEDVIESTALTQAFNDEDPSDVVKIYRFIKDQDYNGANIGELAWDLEGFIKHKSSASRLIQRLKNGGGIRDVVDDRWLPMEGEVVRQAFERLGYDGFVDPTVSDKFRMPGMEKLTTHFIAFNDVDVKSSIGNIGTFSKSDPALLASLSERAYHNLRDVIKERNDIREKYKNTPQWLKAPNGEDTDLPPGSWLDVRTEGFKNYFGDWENDPENSSKVVDWNGEPKIVYHSTFFEFDYFDPEEAGVYGDMGAGFYFSNNPNESGENYGTDTEYYKIIGMAWDIERELGLKKGDPIAIQLAWERLNPDHKGATIPVYLNFRNPVFLGNYYKNKKTILNIDGRARWDKYIKMAEDFIYSKYGEDAHIDMIEEKAMEYGLNDENPSDLAKIYQFIKNGGFEFLDEDVLFKELGQFLPYPASAEDVMAALKDGTALFDVWDSDGSWIGNEIVRQAFEYLGYDGVIDTTVYEKLGMPGMDFNTVHYIAFNNTDIKSAIGNSGKFDKTNPAIRASISKKINLESLKESLVEGKYPTDDELNLHKGDPDIDWEIQFRRIISQDQELVDLFVSSYVDTEWDSEEGVSAEAILKTLKERTDEPLYESILGEVGDPERFIKRLIQEYNYKSPEAATAKFLRDIADRKFLIEVARALTKDSDITNSYWEDDVRIMKLGQAKDDEITYYKVREARSAIRQDPNHYRVKYLIATGQEAQLSFERAGVEEAKSFANRPTNFKNEEITRLLNDKNTDPELVNLIRQNLANGETISALVEHTNNSITKLTQELEESLQAAGLDKEALLDKMAELDVANATLEQLETKYRNLQDINEANYESMRRYRRLYETKVKQLQYVKAKRIIERANRNIKTAINSQARSNDARIMDNLKKIVTVMYESGGEDLTPKLDMLGLDIKSIPQLASFFVVTEDGIFTENPLKSMDVVKVGNLYNAVKSVIVDAKNEKALRDAIKKQETLNIVNQYVAQIGSDKNIESFKDVHEFTKELKMDGHIRGAVDSKAAGQKGRAKAFLDTKLLTMSRIIKKIDGDKGNVLEAYLLGGRDNEGTLHLGIEGVIDAEKRAEFERYGAGKEMLQKLGITEKDLIRKHINVRGVELSLDEAIGVYVYSQQAEGKSKLLSENGNRFTQSDIDKVIDSLSDNHKLWGDWMISDMMGKYDEIADVFYNVNNQILGKIAKYFPLVREGKNESFSDLMQDSYLNMQENPDDTPTHRRTGADYKLQLNATTIWSQMVRKQEHYIAGAEFFNNANFLMRQSGGDLYNMIAFRAGETYANSLQDFINRVARKRYAIDDMDGILNTVRNNLIVARLGFNILTVFKQIPSLGYFAMEYGPVRLMEAISHMVMDYKGTTEFIYERAPQLRSRSSSIDFSSVMEMHPKNEYQRVVKKIGEIGMSPIQFVDGLVVKTLWYGAYQNNIANGMIETEAAMNATKFINDTQPGGLAKDTAAIYHTNSTLMRFLTMFSSQLNKNLNIAHDIPYAIKNRMYSQAFKNMIGLGLSFAGIMFIQGGYKDSDDDDKIIDDMFRSLSSQLAAMIPIFGSDISSIINGNYYSDNGLPLMSETFSLVSAIGSDREDKIERIINNSVRFGLGAMETSGAPAGQARKIYETFTRDDEINLWYLLGHGFGD